MEMDQATTISQHLFSLANRGIKYNLQRIRDAAAQCGNPQWKYKTIHVAGTNGKGSTCTYIESVLRKSGYKTGLYSSPHIVSFSERFLVNGVPVDESEWLEVYKELQKIIEKFNLTFFEAATLMAFELFKKKGVDYAVFETGLGGRLDATNIIDPEVSVITRIAMDHMDFLGNTITSIAKEKLGIVKENRPLVFANANEPELNDIARKICFEKNAPFHAVSISDAQLISDDETGLHFLWNNMNFDVSLPGSFQFINALLALNVLQCIGIKNAEILKSGLSAAFIPGRFQVLSIKNKTVILDVGHNPDAATVLVDTLKKFYTGKSICFVTGIMKDKDTKGIIEKYLSISKHVILTRPETERAEQPQLLMQHIDKSFVGQCEINSMVSAAVNNAIDRQEEIICIAGSFYTVGEAFVALGINPYG